MLDVVFLAMFGVVPALFFSIFVVLRKWRNYLLHKRIQLSLAIILLVAVGFFEADLQLVTNWRVRAEPSPYYQTWVFPVLYVHLACSVPTFALWVAVIVRALRNFDSPPQPNPHSAWHCRFGWAATWGMALTAFTGWCFYVLAFVM